MVFVRGQQMEDAGAHCGRFKHSALYDVGAEFGSVIVAVDDRDQNACKVLFWRCTLILDHYG